MADDGGAGKSRSERRERLARDATDYAWLEVRLATHGVDGLIADLTEREDLEYWYSDSPPVRRALVRGRALLAADPAALPTVLARYLWGEEEAIERLRTQAKARISEPEPPPWQEVTLHDAEIPWDGPWVESVVTVPPGERAVVVGSDGAVSLVEPLAEAVLADRPAPDGGAITTAASLAGGWLYVGDVAGRVVRWRVDAGGLGKGPETVMAPDPALDLDERPGRVALAVAALSDGRRLLAGCVDGAVRLVDLPTGSTRWSGAHEGSVNALAVTPDGRLAVSGADDGAVRVWDVATGREVHTLRGHTRSVRAVAVSTDGRRVVSGSADRTARIWEDGRCVQVLAGAPEGGDPVPELGPAPSGTPGHWRAVEAVALTADGHDVLTGSTDHSVRVWDAASGEETAVLAGNRGAVRALAVGDGWVLSGGHDGRLLAWDAVLLGLATGPVTVPVAAASEPETVWTSPPNRLSREHDRALRWADRASTTTSREVVDGIAVQVQVDVTIADDVEALVWTVVGPAPQVEVDLTRDLARIARRHPGVTVAIDDVFTGVGETVEPVVAVWWRGRSDGVADAVGAVAAAAAEIRAKRAAS